MESNPEGDEIMYGPKDLTYNVKSEITSMQVNYDEKENVNLVNKIAEKFTFIKSETLLENIKKSKEEKKEEDNAEVEEELPKQGRNLFSISASRTFNIASFNVLGQTVSVKYEVGISGNRAYNKIVISSGIGSFSFGNTGCSGEVSWSKSYTQTIFRLVVPPFPAVQVGCFVKGSVYIGFGFSSGSGQSAKYWAKASGSLALGAEISAGFGSIASLSAYAQGTVISASGQVTLQNRSVSGGSGFSISVGRLEVGIKGTLVGIHKTLWSTTLYGGKTIYG